MHKSAIEQQKNAWGERFDALRDLPVLGTYLWNAAPTAVAGTILLRIVGGLSPLAMLYVAKQIIDLLANASSGTAVPLRDAMTWVAIEFALAVISQIIGRTVDYLDSIIADRFSQSLGLAIMRHACSLDLGSFEDPAFQDRLDRARAQTTDRVSMLTSAGWLLQRIVMLLSLVGGIVYYSPWLLTVLVITVLPAFLVESHFAFLGYRLSHELTASRRLLDYFLNMGSSREAAKEVKLFGLGGHLANRFCTVSDEVVLKNRLLAGRRLRWGAGMAIFATSGYYASYAYLASLALSRSISLGTFSFLAGAIAGANGHLQTIFSLFSGIADQALFLRDLVQFFREQPKLPQAKPGLIAPRPIRRGLEFENVSFSYPGTQRLVLNGMSMRWEQGSRIALVGENGEGKTTVVKLITRLYDPTDGRIFLDGVDLREYNMADLRNEIGVVFQDFLRLDLPVRENIAVGNIAKLGKDEALWEAAHKGNASQLIEGLPNRLDQMLGKRFEGGVDLSGGEWQRMALARAYLRDAQLLILDEPTAALDPAAEYEVFQKFSDLSRDRMALFISHRYSTVRMADRILLMSGGRVVEDGGHEELMAAGGGYSRLFEIQAAGYR